jgi:hypothetical protein
VECPPSRIWRLVSRAASIGVLPYGCMPLCTGSMSTSYLKHVYRGVEIGSFGVCGYSCTVLPHSAHIRRVIKCTYREQCIDRIDDADIVRYALYPLITNKQQPAPALPLEWWTGHLVPVYSKLPQITLFISGFLRDAQNASRHLTTARE